MKNKKRKIGVAMLILIILVGIEIFRILNGNSLINYYRVKEYCELVNKYAKEYEIEEYEDYLLAIIQVESKGKGNDIMQSSESLGLDRNTLTIEESVKQGCEYFLTLLNRAKIRECDLNSVVQAYNYGISYLNFISENGGKNTYELSVEYAKKMSKGKKVNYYNILALMRNGGWRYKYGNMFYSELVNKYRSNYTS